MLRFHVQTAGSTLTAQQPDVNIVRTALQAMAAVLGGAQSLHTNSRDEALALPTEESARIALRTQQIIAHESGVVNTADPVGGSEQIEELTDSIERGVTEYLRRIDEMGGTLRAIETGLHPGRDPERRVRMAARRRDAARAWWSGSTGSSRTESARDRGLPHGPGARARADRNTAPGARVAQPVGRDGETGGLGTGCARRRRT